MLSRSALSRKPVKALVEGVLDRLMKKYEVGDVQIYNIPCLEFDNVGDAIQSLVSGKTFYRNAVLELYIKKREDPDLECCVLMNPFNRRIYIESPEFEYVPGQEIEDYISDREILDTVNLDLDRESKFLKVVSPGELLDLPLGSKLGEDEIFSLSHRFDIY